ncbi:MAG TPA: hypothetical protein VL122_08875 [Nitrospirota bacterium]|nr:hypothetical protein [Nitrospirota bacterium]
MRRFVILLFSIAFLMASFACSSKKLPEQVAVKSKNILTSLREMTQAYEKKDLNTFLSGISDQYRDRAVFAKSLTGVFAKYENIHFNIQYTRMIILIELNGQIAVTFTWDAEWQTAGGASVKDGSRVTLIFEPKNNKLLSIEGKNPFLVQPGEAPGKS